MTRRRRPLVIILVLVVILLLPASTAADLAVGLPLRQPPSGTTWTLRQYISGVSSVSAPAGRLTMRFTPAMS